jgi:hypothetical protein
MAIRPQYIQDFINTVRGQIDINHFLAAYDRALAFKGYDDTENHFMMYAVGYLDGHGEGFKNGVKGLK